MSIGSHADFSYYEQIFGRNPERYRRVLHLLQEELSDYFQSIRQSYLQGDAQGLRRNIHRLNPQLDMLQLSALRQSIDELGRTTTASMHVKDQLSSNLHQCFVQLQDDIARKIAQLSSEPTT
ncbi:hypothetical protein SAMN05421823_101546 [Catalinimonas alkaloidigena]|uniref:HPt domain-containing protein n=1 Tax=Catalinimonas alkaloidigena TaxID=1075417 RepID=A0A1G8Y408_9BACT|nr:hypothetical protein [Catalinimonas alkaloidigena]SDJ96835.1 hypothetical protein SAMN05421823_101546 [Catalinimonas alkaloidigena]